MKLYNTLTRKKEVFTPINNKISIYVCGITPYDTTHLGHAFTYISFDVLIRYLEFNNFKVNYTQNVTDINDRDNDILKRAKEQNMSWQSLSNIYTKKFLDDMEKLNWRIPDNYLYASKEIKNMIFLINRLMKNGVAYEVGGSVYLDIKKDKDYGKLSALPENEMIRIAKDYDEDVENLQKRTPLDITLWRATSLNQPAHIPSFNSPFGKGRPGWHIECSAMAIYSLGEQIDIHGGGKDLIFPHHEAEISQSESATGKIPFAKTWMHTGIISYQGEKMSKSLGNLVLISDLLKKYSANAIRFLILSHHYRDSWEFNDSEVENAQGKVLEIEKVLKEELTDNRSVMDYERQFQSFMNDDLDTPKALELIFKIVKGINTGNEKPGAKTFVKKSLEILGFS